MYPQVYRAGQIQGFFDIPLNHLHGIECVVPYLKKLKTKKLIFASPDAGGTERVRDYTKKKYFDVDFVICDKHRNKANKIKAMQVIGDVEDKDVVLVDDLIDTGGTISKASNLIMEKGGKIC